MRNWLAVARGAGFGLILSCAAAAAFAQDRTLRVWDTSTFISSIISTIVFGLIGILMTIMGFKLFDAVIHFNLIEEICEKQNIAVAILSASVILGISLVIAIAIY